MNTLNVQDVAQLARRMPVYDFMGTGWPIGASANLEPVSRFGIGAVRTSRREQGFGELGQIMEATVLGIPIVLLGAGLIAAFVWPGFLKK